MGKMLPAKNLTGHFNIMFMGYVFGLQKHSIGSPDLRRNMQSLGISNPK
jgi:hypothetical protein